MEGDIATRGLRGDTGGSRGCDLGNDRQTGESPEHVPDARYRCDAEQRHIADIWGEAAETAHRRDRLHTDAGPPYLADHGRSEQVSPAEGGAVSQCPGSSRASVPALCLAGCPLFKLQASSTTNPRTSPSFGVNAATARGVDAADRT
jgi:hypothetical protein